VTPDLVARYDGIIAAGLDATDPEPLPIDHPLLGMCKLAARVQSVR